MSSHLSGRNSYASGPHMALLLPNDKTCFSSAILTWIRFKRMNVQVVSNYRDDCGRPRGNGDLVVDLSRNPNDGLRKGQNIIFRCNTRHVIHDRVHPQSFLGKAGDRLSSTDRLACRQTFTTASKYGIESKSSAARSSSPLALIRPNVSIISARRLSWTWRFLASSQRVNDSYRIG